MVDPDRLRGAFHQARADLLAERDQAGHWVGELASSPLSTATAISALVLAEQHGRRTISHYVPDEIYQGDLSELIVQSLRWLAERQNADGGWGDTDKSCSNLATTMLVAAAFHLTGVPVKSANLLERADAYIKAQGGIAGLKARYGKDKTFAVPILTNCALAERVPWKKVFPLPFELACLPQAWYRWLKLPVVSYAIPALVAIGHARFFHRPPKNPLTRLLRRSLVKRSLAVLRQLQPQSGGFLEAAPLTSFVVMSLASTGQADHPVTRRGVEFLLASVRPDGSWPIDTNLATWNTTLALGALSSSPDPVAGEPTWQVQAQCLDWVLACQHLERHPFTGADPGGWAWTDLTGGVPDADDTPSALLALAGALENAAPQKQRQIVEAACKGVEWLLGLQNRDGGFPTFCRGWGALPFDRSGSDLTAHALRALHTWRRIFISEGGTQAGSEKALPLRMERAIETGMRFLVKWQRSDGSWLPLWFGNQHLEGETNPLYGTSRVLLAFRDLGLIGTPAARRGLAWLARAQQPSGGWGGGSTAVAHGFANQAATVEETALAVEALLAAEDASVEKPLEEGLYWLVSAVERGAHRESSPIGLYFAKLWYYERLYPYIHTVSALGHAVARDAKQPASRVAAHLSSA